MDTFEHESQYGVHLCDHRNEPTYICFEEVLNSELGAEQVDEMWSPGVSWLRLVVEKAIITVQEEDYMGISVFGPKPIIDNLMVRVQRNMLE